MGSLEVSSVAELPTATTDTILFYVNGKRREIRSPDPQMTLLTYLRTKERLTGTKLGCGEGGCGACSVMLSSYDHATGRIYYRAINSCLMPLCAVDGLAVTTVEGIGGRRGGLHPVQKRLVEYHGSQCGFCTPGFVVAMESLIRNKASEGDVLTERDVEENFDGNLCRCTGYRPILDACKTFAKSKNGCCQANGSTMDPCPCRNIEEPEDILAKPVAPCSNVFLENETELLSEPIFPAELIFRPSPFLAIRNQWFRPLTLVDLFSIKAKYPDSKVVVGNTELGIEMKFKGASFSCFIYPSAIEELNCIASNEEGLIIGAAVTLAKLQKKIQQECKERPEHETRSLQAINEQLRLFAGKQIRNACCVGGNIATASPISDLNPLWIAVEASFIIVNVLTGTHRVIKARRFFHGYRQTDLRNDNEILLKIKVPWNHSIYNFIYSFKTSRRKDDDIAIVSAGIRLELKPPVEDHKHWTFASASIGLGGMAPKTIAVLSVEKFLINAEISQETLDGSLQRMSEVCQLPKNVPGGMPEFRQSLALGFLFKALLRAVNDTGKVLRNSDSQMKPPELGTPREIMGITDATRRLSCGRQTYSGSTAHDCLNYHLGKSLNHVAAGVQVSGEAVYVDDVPKVDRELSAALLLSSVPHGKILSIDTTKAERIPGFVSTVFADDVRGSNDIGPVIRDEKCFTESTVTCVGQVIGLVLAETPNSAAAASRAVTIEYEELPAIITIEEAIAASSFAHGEPQHRIVKGDAEAEIIKAREEGNIVSGEVHIGAQEHFYLEPQGSLVVPGENDEMSVYASTQAACKTQSMVAGVLGVPTHKVRCKVKRIGGGFGGKETRSVFLSAALAVGAQKESRPVRLCLDRDIDMATTGTRHAFYAKYTCAFDVFGRIKALEVQLYLNMGNSFDLSIPVLDRALFHLTNCYDVPNVSLQGLACYTNCPTATAMRGFGGNQAMLICENIIEHVAHKCNLSPETVRSRNLYGKNGNASTTPYGMDFFSDPLIKCWDGVMVDSDFDARSKKIQEFNRHHRYRKRGIAALPTMFGISFTFRTYNQAGALVHIYHADGSVLVTHGGVEMGQGLHTKMTMAAASALGIPLEKVYISDTATDKVPNASPSAASSSSDMYGMAIIDACKQLNKRLLPIKKRLGGEASWEDIVQTAWFERICLSAQGFYKTPSIDALDLSDPNKSRGRPFFYFTNGAAVTEIELDCLTGEHQVLGTNIFMDVGRPLNPALDFGQIEGAFLQGLGWCTLEEVVRGSSTVHRWLRNGRMHTLGPSTYKIPSSCSIPLEFRVTILENNPCDQETIGSSKAIGEPPLFLGASVLFAIRHAIREARKECGRSSWFTLDSPASVERIRTLCPDKIMDRYVDDTFRPDLTL